MHFIRHNPSLLIGAIITAALCLIAIFAPLLATHGVEQMDMANRLQGPSGAHWLGTDNFGRDLWTRLAYGARLSLGVSIVAVTIAVVIGTVVGLLAGYFGGWVDMVLMRITDIFLGFPALILAMAIVAIIGPGTVNLIVAMVMVFWTEYARVIRAATLSLRSRPYVEAARTTGASHIRIIFREILPNALGPIIILATLGLGTAIITESALSFLGFGLRPPAPTWGGTLSYGTRFLAQTPWLCFAAGLTIMLACLGFNMLGDGLRDLLDPKNRLRKGEATV
ncbi:ABC transporter permease [Ketogulonicigenium vulgare]|uniref:Oligopeptide ABC transporter permease protein n=1 Tax=Ketogulonicigenium vulgare (strain WSH-001) TaxID=759362 RepID=F9YB43_KETVW|nr:ABC transporter permease [Ketogulonicigenium vulgare]ADO44070.1 oligopeptide ABC transporter permease protein [Ketogulonicigenium vulgare Y25]AEM42595.1 Oligopeptide ABC transporter permease protein [Ketogulonicigenium vulgare WSH-001]ALJ82622.1 peptide ABC transporter permease [Ketogulonicigenium vulgare]ANW35376.1 peptide ABC transporter permease [Ketogulonicigenium vulgare]AOZ53296.1 oligopeptide ABC transporter permease protein [Ketogulonicigenium vulgare]